MHENGSLNGQSIEIGGCYAISLNGNRAFVKILRKITPNSQGVVGPPIWIGERVGTVDDPDQEGKEIEVAQFDFTGRASRREMVVQAIRQGFETDKDIYDYLVSCGIGIRLTTVSVYRCQYHNGTLYASKPKRKNTPTNTFQDSDGPDAAALTVEICRLAKKVGGLKALGETVDSLLQALESAT